MVSSNIVFNNFRLSRVVSLCIKPFPSFYFPFLDKRSPRFLMTKSFFSFHADKYFMIKTWDKKNKFETINQQCSPKAVLSGLVEKNKINLMQSFYQYWILLIQFASGTALSIKPNTPWIYNIWWFNQLIRNTNCTKQIPKMTSNILTYQWFQISQGKKTTNPFCCCYGQPKDLRNFL